MNRIASSGEWSEERLYVLQTVDDLKEEQRRQLQASAADRAALVEKAQRDITAAHDKIRRLESTKLSLTIKTWALAAALGGLFTVAIELFKLAHK